MQFDFSDDQKELQTSVRRFFEKYSPTTAARSVLESDAGYDTALWRQVGEQGFLAAALPEEYGGVGAGYLELCVVAEEVGRALAPLPTVPSIYQAAEFLLLAGSEDQKSEWLPKIASGETIGTVALVERPGELSSSTVATKAQGNKLSGTKLPVSNGMDAGLAIVAAQSDDGLSLYLVDLAGPGVERSGVNTIDPSLKHATITFAGAPAEPLGPPGAALDLIAKVRDRAAVLTAFEQIGGADAALMTARDYALGRFAFGRPIGSFQAIKHMLADMYVSLELARSNCYYGAWALAGDSEKLPLAAATARVAATQAYQLCSANNIQVHGGMGFTWEFDCHLHYRRSNYLATALGGQGHWEERLIASMRPVAA